MLLYTVQDYIADEIIKSHFNNRTLTSCPIRDVYAGPRHDRAELDHMHQNTEEALSVKMLDLNAIDHIWDLLGISGIDPHVHHV